MKPASLLLGLFFLAGCGVNSVPSTPDYLSGDFSGCATGAFVNGLTNLASFQTAAGKNLAVILWYVHWSDPFPTAEADQVEANGSIPLITWEPWLTAEAGTLEAIAAGSYESYVTQFLTAAKNWGKPLFLRFAHEMNGNWYPWDGAHNGGAAGAAKYKAAWQYIYSVRQAVGADNVKLVWCPNNTNVPAESWNSPEAYYPGDQYVDWIGMDGYNWGYSAWQTFDQVFGAIYATLTGMTAKPLMLGELAAATAEGSKAAWLTDAFSRIKNNYPRVKVFNWFNINKERDWRIESSADAQAAFKTALQESYFLGTIK